MSTSSLFMMVYILRNILGFLCDAPCFFLCSRQQSRLHPCFYWQSIQGSLRFFCHVPQFFQALRTAPYPSPFHSSRHFLQQHPNNGTIILHLFPIVALTNYHRQNSLFADNNTNYLAVPSVRSPRWVLQS